MRRCANIEFLRMPAGRFEAMCHVDQASAVADVAAIVFNVAPGDAVGAVNDKDQRPGYVVALSDSSSAAVAACTSAKAMMRVRIQGIDTALPLT